MTTFEDGTEYGTREWAEFLSNNPKIHRTIEGRIAEVKCDLNDGRGFPTFVLETGTKSIEWERHSSPGIFRTYPNDKCYKVGKRASVTVVDQLIKSTTNKLLNVGNSIQTVVYVDVEK